MDLFEIGRILKPRGLKGQMRCLSYLESDGLRDSLKEVFVRTPDGNGKRYPVREILFAGEKFFLSVEGVHDPETARLLAGADVLASAELLEPLADDEFYWRDIIGLNVVTESGQSLGKVAEIFSTGSNDVYVCRNGEKETLLPAIADVIQTVDLRENRMVVRLLEGL